PSGRNASPQGCTSPRAKVSALTARWLTCAGALLIWARLGPGTPTRASTTPARAVRLRMALPPLCCQAGHLAASSPPWQRPPFAPAPWAQASPTLPARLLSCLPSTHIRAHVFRPSLSQDERSRQRDPYHRSAPGR